MADRTMRAMVAVHPGGAEVLHLTRMPVPEPGPGEVRIEVRACGLNPLDLMARRGDAPWITPHWPIVLGVEHCGVVDGVGDGVDPAWLGRPVTSTTVMGGNAEYSAVPLSSILPCPGELDLNTAAVYRGATHTAWRLLEMFGPPDRSGGWVLVHSAAGAIGVVLTQIAKAKGLRVVGIVGSAGKAEWARQFGADHLIAAAAEEWVEPVRAAVAGDRIQLAVDGNGGPGALMNLDVLAPLGTLVLIGASSGIQAPPISPRQLIAKSIRVAGFSLPLTEALLGDVARVDAEVVAMLSDGRVRMPITRVAALEDIPDLHRAFEARALMGRTLIRISD
jgi:NADPH2:quinone reductase